MVDAHASGACGAIHGGSSPLFGTLFCYNLTAMVEKAQEEHFFRKKIEDDDIQDDVVIRTKSYDRTSLGLSEGSEQVSIKEFTIPLEQNTVVLRLAEMSVPDEIIDKDKPGRTLVIVGGGTSPGPGTNVKLGVELIEKLKSKKQKTDIHRIIFVSNPAGAPREKIHIDHDNLQHSADLAAQALKKVGIDSRNNLLFMGFSAGGALSLELVALLEKKAEDHTSPPDLILIEPAGTFNADEKIMENEFWFGSAKGILRRTQGKPLRERARELWKESQNSWATIDGVPSFVALVKEVFTGAQKRHLEYAEAYGMSAKNLAPVITDVSIMAKDFTKDDRDTLTGNVLIIEYGGSKIVHTPATRLNSGEISFPHAKSVRGVTLEGTESHSFLMADDGRTMDTITDWLR